MAGGMSMQSYKKIYCFLFGSIAFAGHVIFCHGAARTIIFPPAGS